MDEAPLCGWGVAAPGFDLADDGVLGGRPAVVGEVNGVPTPLLISPVLFLLLLLVVTIKTMRVASPWFRLPIQPKSNKQLQDME